MILAIAHHSALPFVIPPHYQWRNRYGNVVAHPLKEARTSWVFLRNDQVVLAGLSKTRLSPPRFESYQELDRTLLFLRSLSQSALRDIFPNDEYRVVLGDL